MIESNIATINSMLSEYTAFGCKALGTPFVLVLKADAGTFVVYQRESCQKTTFLGKGMFGENVSIDYVYDIEVSAKKHVIALVICHHDAEGHATDKDYFIVGEKGNQSSHVTAFFAYEADPGKSVNCISIIEEPESKPVFTDAIRFGRSSTKLLKTQLRMYLTLAGIGTDIREKIVSGGGFLPSSNGWRGGVDYDD